MARCVPPLLVCLALAACSGEPDPRGVARDEVLVQVAATGHADTRPDEAQFTAGVETIAATAREASARNSETINRVAASLERLGVKRDDLQTRSITLNRIDYGPNRGRYQANNLIEVRVRDLQRAGEAIAATTEVGANVLSGPNLRVSDPEAASRSAYAQAYKAARARAEAYAGAAGLKVTRVLAIRDAGGGGEPPPVYYGDASLERAAPTVAQAAPPVMAGVTTRQVSIRADFALGR
jgi:uncharacterized protein YggE